MPWAQEIRFPHLPLVLVRSAKKEKVGTTRPLAEGASATEQWRLDLNRLSSSKCHATSEGGADVPCASGGPFTMSSPPQPQFSQRPGDGLPASTCLPLTPRVVLPARAHQPEPVLALPAATLALPAPGLAACQGPRSLLRAAVLGSLQQPAPGVRRRLRSRFQNPRHTRPESWVADGS